MSLRDEHNWMVYDNVMSDYLEVCKDAVENDVVFHVFKKDKRYKTILEHWSRKLVLAYLRKIKQENPILLSDRKLFSGNDLFGSPEIMNFNIDRTGIGFDYSASTIQYMGVLSNLLTHFKDVSKKSIVEIVGAPVPANSIE